MAEQAESTPRKRTTVGAVREEIELLITRAKDQRETHRREVAELSASIDAYQRVLAVMDKTGE